MPHPLQGVRYVTTLASGGEGQAILTRQVGRLYGARLVGYTGAALATLYDHSRYPQRPIVLLNAGGFMPQDDFPKQPVHLGFDQGLYVSFSMGTGQQVLTVLWEKSGGVEEGGTG